MLGVEPFRRAGVVTHHRLHRWIELERHAHAQTIAGISTATQISAGSGFTCARLSNGTAKCWGSNSNGELGTGNTSTALLPVSVVGFPALGVA